MLLSATQKYSLPISVKIQNNRREKEFFDFFFFLIFTHWNRYFSPKWFRMFYFVARSIIIFHPDIIYNRTATIIWSTRCKLTRQIVILTKKIGHEIFLRPFWVDNKIYLHRINSSILIIRERSCLTTTILIIIIQPARIWFN